MRNKVIIGSLVLLIITLLANKWFIHNKDKRLQGSLKHDTITLTKFVNKKDSTTIEKFEENKGDVVKNYITNKYMTYVQDTLDPALNIATSKINELTRAKLVLEGKLKESRRELNENKKARIYYENKYLQIIANSDSTINYSYNAIVDIVKYREKKGLFSPEKYYIDISSPDPNFCIHGVEHYKKTLNIKAKPWGIGVQGGYYYVLGKNGCYPAFGIGIPITF